jgi:hypothetical protein
VKQISEHLRKFNTVQTQHIHQKEKNSAWQLRKLNEMKQNQNLTPRSTLCFFPHTYKRGKSKKDAIQLKSAESKNQA